MSVIQVLEQFEKKHGSPDDDKAGWKSLIHGAVSKAAGLLWTAGRSEEVTLGPLSHSVDLIPSDIKCTNIRSSTSGYLSLSVDESDTSDDLFLSLDEVSVKIISPLEKKHLRPKSHSTPFKEKEIKRSASETSEKECLDQEKENSKSVPSDDKMGKIIKLPFQESAAGDISGAPQRLELTDLCSEMERLSLKKIISEAEKSIAAEIKEQFDRDREKLEEHDKKVARILATEEEAKRVEEQLLEMNWFQRIRESQLHVEKDFNSKLDTILATTRKVSADKRTQSLNSKSIKSPDERAVELELVAKKRALIEAIGNTQKLYNIKYNEVLNLLQSSRVTLVSEFHSEFESLKTNNTKLTDVISKSKCGNVTQRDIDESTDLLNFLINLFDKIKGRIDEFESAKKLEDEANIKLMEALKKNEENTKNVNRDMIDKEEAKEIVVVPVEVSINNRRTSRLKYYEYVDEILRTAEDSLKPFLNDDKYKNFRKDCQRAVNVPVNAISPTSSQHLVDKLDKLSDLLNGKYVQLMNKRFSATIHPLGIKYCEILLARKIVKAGENVVSSHPETGHSIASVVLAMIMRNSLLFLYLHAYFFRICPYLVPLDLKPEENETDQEYNKRLGFIYEGDQREETDKFLKRMSGVAQLYGAIVVSHKRRIDSSLNSPLGISEIWIWLTNFISLEPLSDISATVLLDLLEVSGHIMLASYGFNFQKLLYFICTDYLVRIDKVTTKGRGGPVERLKTFLEDVIKVKRIPPPKGMLPPSFW